MNQNRVSDVRQSIRKVLTCPRTSAPNRYELEISKEVLYFLLGQTITKLWMLKVGDQKKLRHFGSEATFFASLYDMYSESLLFGLPRFKKPEVQGHDMIFRGQNTPIYYMKCKRVVLICSVHTSSCRCSFWMTP